MMPFLRGLQSATLEATLLQLTRGTSGGGVGKLGQITVYANDHIICLDAFSLFLILPNLYKNNQG